MFFGRVWGGDSGNLGPNQGQPWDLSSTLLFSNLFYLFSSLKILLSSLPEASQSSHSTGSFLAFLKSVAISSLLKIRLVKGAIFVSASIKWKNTDLETDECDFLRRLPVCFLWIFLLCPRVYEKRMAEFTAILIARFLNSEDSGAGGMSI